MRPGILPAPVLAIVAALALAGCAAAPPAELPQRLSPAHQTLPPMKSFGPADPLPPMRSNADMARDFLELSFFMESGRPIPTLSRFEGPITLRMTGAVPPGAEEELGALLLRLRREAGISVTRLPAAAAAGITVEFLPRRQMQAAVPQAACFVVPRVASWDQFRARRRSPVLDWTTVQQRETVAVFIPSDVTRQEMRDCLHEEVAQAMGPLNDLYRLHDSVFNDDNFQTVLTGFDMLMLRVFNDPALRSGMTAEQVAARLPAILARLNPAGERIAPAGPVPRSPRAWITAVETALGPGRGRAERAAAAGRALDIARQQGWRDARLAFAHFLVGRMARPADAELALAAFLEAGSIYRSLPGGEVHAAHVDMQLAAFALSAGQYQDALTLSTSAQRAAMRTQNAALLSSLQMVQAVALDRLGRPAEARTVRMDSLGWARYGFGTDDRVRNRLAEIEALAPPPAPVTASAGVINGRGPRYME